MGGFVTLVLVAGVVAYFICAVLCVWVAVREAKKRGRKGWVWGGVAALFIYHLAFWDLIPKLVLHNYYCFTESGYSVYKTPKQWMQENPGVMETLSLSHLPERFYKGSSSRIHTLNRYYVLPDGTEITALYAQNKVFAVGYRMPNGEMGDWLNERVELTDKYEKRPFGINRYSQELIDYKTKRVLAKYVNFACGDKYSPTGVGTWLVLIFKSTCNCGVSFDEFGKYKSLFQSK